MDGQSLAFAIGFSLGQYEIRDVRGYSAVAIEYLAHDRETDMAVAIWEFLPRSIAVRKGGCGVEPILPQNKAQFDMALEAFLEEAAALAQCGASGINAIRNTFRANGTAYVVAERPAATALDGILCQGPTGSEALNLMLPTLLDALGKLHEAGLLHLDIRPGNIMLRAEGSAMLRGFGAVPMSLGSARQSFGGTPRKRQFKPVHSDYAPIELYSESTAPGPWSDIYSLGATLYHCVTGSTPPPVTDRVLGDSLNLPAHSPVAGIDSKTLSAIKAAMAIVPTARPQSIAQLREQYFSSSQAPAHSQARARFARAAARGGRLSPNAGIVKSAGSVNAGSGASKWSVPALALTAVTVTVAFVDVGVLRPELGSSDSEPSLVHLAMAGRTEAATYNAVPRDAPGGEPESAPAESLAGAEAGATLVVDTVPPNVEVLLGGKPIGYTPLNLPGLPDGVHDLTLRHPHYETVELARQRFTAAEELRIETTLERGFGNLLVTTDPPGAWVEIDDDRVIASTPGTLRQLPAGPVTIKLGAPGHAVTRVAAEVPRGGTGYVARTLSIAYGTLDVDLEPADAQVIVFNDADIAYGYNPEMRLPRGSYRLQVSKQGYREATRTVSVDGETNIRVELHPES